MKNRKFIYYLPYAIVAIFMFSLFYNSFSNSYTKELTYNEFNTILKTNKVSDVEVEVANNLITVKGIYTEEDKKIVFNSKIPNNEIEVTALINHLKESKVTFKDGSGTSIVEIFLVNILPIGLFMFAGWFLLRNISGNNKQAFDFTESKAKLEKNIKIRFSDVAGCEEEKEELKEIIDYLKNPKKFIDMGAHIPRGILMVGSPGTGKTLLAKAVAGESHVPFYSISGSDFMELFVGVGASRVRKMFEKAKSNAPSILFIDEIDTIGRQRGTGLGGGHDEREQTLNQLLVEMDGIGNNYGVIIIAATNRPDILDPALLRPGRFDRQITVSLPDLKAREEILKVHARNKKFKADVLMEEVAKRIPTGFSGADIENVLNEAAILAVRENKKEIDIHHIDEAVDRVMMGPAKKSRKYDEKSKKLVAYHEAGHAIVGLNLEGGAVVQKVTIIPRGTAGGYNILLPKEEKIMKTKKDLLEMIITFMGGRVAEEVFFEDVTTGAINDFERATQIARDMVTLYGMSDLGPIQYDRSGGNVFLGRDYTNPTNVSSQVAFEIDQEVRKIINSCYKQAKDIIINKKAELVKIADALLALETITAKEIDGIYNGTLILEEGKLKEVKAEEN